MPVEHITFAGLRVRDPRAAWPGLTWPRGGGVVRQVLNSGRVIPGYGHAVLRKTDPRFSSQVPPRGRNTTFVPAAPPCPEPPLPARRERRANLARVPLALSSNSPLTGGGRRSLPRSTSRTTPWWTWSPSSTRHSPPTHPLTRRPRPAPDPAPPYSVRLPGPSSIRASRLRVGTAWSDTVPPSLLSPPRFHPTQTSCSLVPQRPFARTHRLPCHPHGDPLAVTGIVRGGRWRRGC